MVRQLPADDAPRDCRRKRRPKLSVVSGELRPPRHRVSFGEWPTASVVEFWTISEWNSLASWEKPENPAFFPGVGYVSLVSNVSAKENKEVVQEYSEAIEIWSERFGE